MTNKTKNILTTLWVIVVLAVFSVGTFADELEVRTTDLTYTWGPNHSFPVTLYQIGYTKTLTRGVGIRVMFGESDTQSDGHRYSSKIEQMFVFNIHRNINIGRDWVVQYGVNYTEYKEHGKSDTGTGYALALQYNINSDYAIKVSYDEYYEKYNDHYGLEQTKGVGLSLVSKF